MRIRSRDENDDIALNQRNKHKEFIDECDR